MARAVAPEPSHATLDNGLKVSYLRMPGHVECCGVAIMAGSRDEQPGEYGLAHFVEHTIFKGTARRRSHHIINRMESVGGELNAYTTKEETFVYTLAPAFNAARSIELIGDLVVNSSFPRQELDKEREVVIDEINSYLDQPDAAVYDDFEDLIYRDSELGHNILGSPKTLKNLDTDDCRRWVERCYHAGRMVFFYAGPMTFDRVMSLASKHLTIIPSTGAAVVRHKPIVADTFSMNRNIRSHQAHTILGLTLEPDDIRSRDALALCNNILGGPGMNSKFNVSLREKRGLVYTVDSSITRYCDTTLWSVYYGCDEEHVDKCSQLIKEELSCLACGNLNSRSLNMARRQFLGQLTLGRAGVENVAMSLGRCALREERYRTPAELTASFEALTPADISLAATALYNAGHLSSLTFK